LVAALFGTGLVGWFDPFSLLVRSLGTSILPGINYAVNAGLQALETSEYAPIQAVGTLLHSTLRATVLSFKQPYFRQGVYLGLIFVFILALNLRITRFWCRAICPLGALLGSLSRWSILGLQKKPETCNNCNRCLMHCQGGDDPIGTAAWHKSECHLCLNCVSQCPEHSLEFKFFPASATVDHGHRGRVALRRDR
jgi:ferredoxin